jgi:signal transduction histidine kinase
MNHHILHVGLKPENSGLPWNLDLTSRNVVIYQVTSVREAVHFRRAYSLMMVLIDIHDCGEETVEAVSSIASTSSSQGCGPLVGLLYGEPSAEERGRLAKAGLDHAISRLDPERFLLHHLTTLIDLTELRQFEQARMDVNALALRTRECLHDLSQPLSAVQGRLQLLASRCPQDDPNCKCLNDLVQLIMQVSQQVGEIHQIHRKFS